MLEIVARWTVVSIDLENLSRTYFYFDIPVKYKLKNEHVLEIYPIDVCSSEIFLSSVQLLTIDKNSLPDPKIIQMSYLQFICDFLIRDPSFLQRMVNILTLCLHTINPKIVRDELNRPAIIDNELGYKITHREFDDIKKIILYQNLIHYDDEYINPEFKKAMDEMDELKAKQYEMPNIERKIAIITAHTGLSKKEQLSMTLRSHSLLFEEVTGEVDFTTMRAIALFAGKGNEIDHWIYKKKTGKFDKYVTQVDAYTKSMGGGKQIKSSNTDLGDFYTQQFKNFHK